MIAGDDKVIDEKTYIFDEDGRMLTGWGNSKDYTSSSNWNLSNEDTADILFFDDNGAAVEGWHYMSAPDGSDDYWFYFKAGRAYSPEYKTTVVGEYGMAKINNETYCFDEEGHMVTGLIQVKDGRYFFFDEDNGIMITGRATISNDEFDEQEFYFPHDFFQIPSQKSQRNHIINQMIKSKVKEHRSKDSIIFLIFHNLWYKHCTVL